MNMYIEYESTQDYFMEQYEKALLETQKGNSLASSFFNAHIYHNLNLCGLNFYGFSFSNVEFVNCNFFKCNFEASKFTNCKFTGDTTINKCNFSQTVFMETVISDAFVKNCEFKSVFFTEDSNFGWSYFVDNHFNRTTISQEVFQYTTFYNNVFTDKTHINFSFTIRGLELTCPEEGSFIGFKKAVISGGKYVLVKLLIPEDAKRLSSNGRKCRCDKAKVLAITSFDEKENYETAISVYNPLFKYRVGEEVIAEDFEDDRRLECRGGVHFFITKQEAIDY